MSEAPGSRHIRRSFVTCGGSLTGCFNIYEAWINTLLSLLIDFWKSQKSFVNRFKLGQCQTQTDIQYIQYGKKGFRAFLKKNVSSSQTTMGINRWPFDKSSETINIYNPWYGRGPGLFLGLLNHSDIRKEKMKALATRLSWPFSCCWPALIRSILRFPPVLSSSLFTLLQMTPSCVSPLHLYLPSWPFPLSSKLVDLLPNAQLTSQGDEPSGSCENILLVLVSPLSAGKFTTSWPTESSSQHYPSLLCSLHKESEDSWGSSSRVTLWLLSLSLTPLTWA